MTHAKSGLDGSARFDVGQANDPCLAESSAIYGQCVIVENVFGMKHTLNEQHMEHNKNASGNDGLHPKQIDGQQGKKNRPAFGAKCKPMMKCTDHIDGTAQCML